MGVKCHAYELDKVFLDMTLNTHTKEKPQKQYQTLSKLKTFVHERTL